MELKKYKLGDLLQVTRGASLSGEYYATQGNYIRLTCGNFDYRNNCFKENQSKDNIYYVGDFKEEFLLEKGDIITPLTEQAIGLLGSTARIPESGKYIQSQDIAKIDCNESLLDKDFAFYLISSACVKQQLSAAAQQTKIRHTSPDKIKECTVWIPSLDIQKRIGRILTDIDNKIAINRQINDNLEAMAKQLYDYWFVQFDFPNEEGKPYKSSGGAMVWNEDLHMSIPCTWKTCLLSDYISSNNTGDWGFDEPAKKKSIKVGCIRGADIVKLNNLPIRYIKDNNTSKLLSAWDIVIEVSGGSPTQATGRSAFVTPGVLKRNGGNLTCSNFCHAFTMKDHKASAYFYFMWRMFYDNNNMFNFEGKTSGIKNFMTDTFLANKWLDVPTALLYLFFERVKVIYEQIDNNIEEVNTLTKQRDELLPLLMNGQASVNYHLSAKVYPLPIAYKKVMPIVTNQTISNTFIQKFDNHTPSPCLQTSNHSIPKEERNDL